MVAHRLRRRLVRVRDQCGQAEDERRRRGARQKQRPHERSAWRPAQVAPEGAAEDEPGQADRSGDNHGAAQNQITAGGDRRVVSGGAAEVVVSIIF